MSPVQVRFQDDSIDETVSLSRTLQESGSVGSLLDLTVQALPGDHLRPLQQPVLPDVPPEVLGGVSQAASQAGEFLEGLSGLANLAGVKSPLGDLSRGMRQFQSSLGVDARGGDRRAAIRADVEDLVDNLLDWMGMGGGNFNPRGPKVLPAGPPKQLPPSGL